MSQPDQNPDALLELFARFMRNSMHSAIIHSREFGLSMPQLSTLMILRKKQVSAISEIAEELGVSSAAASQMIDRMVNEGLILRAESPDDRRVKQVRLTDKGRQLLRENFKARRQWITEIIESLSDKEKEHVYQAFNILVQKIGLPEQSPSPENGHSPKP